MERHYWRMVRDTQRRVEKSLRVQVLREDSARYGGFPDDTGVVDAKYSIYRTASMMACYCNPDTAYYHDGRLLERILPGLAYVRRAQHENGLFDYITCNFFSAPDTAFCLKKLLPIYQYLAGKEREAGEERIFEKVGEILKSGAYGLLEGGFHTPNHRWAIASVLMACGKLFGCGRMAEAAGEYLREGIDCNEDGEYTERSAGNYNRVNNDAMILLSQVTGDASYEQNAVRNLRMMLTYQEPDGSIFTANSTRFDKDRLIYPKDYYMEYLRMGMKYGITEFLQMCNAIFEIVEEKGISSPDFLIWFMLEPAFRSFEYEGSYRRPDFRCYYRESGIARGQQGRFTYTILEGKSEFFYLHNGTVKLGVKVAGSFCEHRAFCGGGMERISEKEYHLSQIMRGWYYLPFREKPDSADWRKMDHAAREKKTGPDMRIDVWVREVENGVDIRVRTSGVEGAPWRIELAFSGGKYLENETLYVPLAAGGTIVAGKGYFTVGNGQNALRVGPCFGEHRFTEGKEDSEPKSPDAATVYLTDDTSFDHTIEVRSV